MNEFFDGPRGAQFDAMYYWDQFHPILAAIVILLVGWIIALLVATGVKKLLQKVNTNAKLSSATGRRPKYRRPDFQGRILVYSNFSCCCGSKCTKH